MLCKFYLEPRLAFGSKSCCSSALSSGPLTDCSSMC